MNRRWFVLLVFLILSVSLLSRTGKEVHLDNEYYQEMVKVNAEVEVEKELEAMLTKLAEKKSHPRTPLMEVKPGISWLEASALVEEGFSYGYRCNEILDEASCFFYASYLLTLEPPQRFTDRHPGREFYFDLSNVNVQVTYGHSWLCWRTPEDYPYVELCELVDLRQYLTTFQARKGIPFSPSSEKLIFCHPSVGRDECDAVATQARSLVEGYIFIMPFGKDSDPQLLVENGNRVMTLSELR